MCSIADGRDENVRITEQRSQQRSMAAPLRRPARRSALRSSMARHSIVAGESDTGSDGSGAVTSVRAIRRASDR